MVELLIARGVRAANAQSLIADHAAPRIEQAIAYFDAESQVGPGVLVAAIREGRSPAPRPLDSIERNRRYARQVCDWLNTHFPDLCQPSGHPHPAAAPAVFRLHHRYGKGRLTVREHGPQIRAAVKAFDQRYPPLSEEDSDG